jgi:hypothetical protein
MAASGSRVPVAKTYKIYIDGKFPRTESGRYFVLENSDGNVIATPVLICAGKSFIASQRCSKVARISSLPS